MLLHNAEKLNNDLRTRADEHLSFPSFFCIIDSVERIIKNTCFNHADGFEILNSRIRDEVSAKFGKIPHQQGLKNRK